MSRSESVENYLKTILDLETGDSPASTGAVALRLGVAPASVTGMLKRLAARGLVLYRPYRGAVLSDDGRRAALGVQRRHRLIETFLARVMDVPADQVHDEAERWEHVVSDAMAERMADILGHPDHDPHGAPIPPRPAEPGGSP